MYGWELPEKATTFGDHNSWHLIITGTSWNERSTHKNSWDVRVNVSREVLRISSAGSCYLEQFNMLLYINLCKKDCVYFPSLEGFVWCRIKTNTSKYLSKSGWCWKVCWGGRTLWLCSRGIDTITYTFHLATRYIPV